MFHADTDVRIGHEGSVETDDVDARAIVHDLKFSKDLLSNGGFGVDEDELKEGRGTRVKGNRVDDEREVSLLASQASPAG